MRVRARGLHDLGESRGVAGAVLDLATESDRTSWWRPWPRAFHRRLEAASHRLSNGGVVRAHTKLAVGQILKRVRFASRGILKPGEKPPALNHFGEARTRSSTAAPSSVSYTHLRAHET